MPRLLLRPGWIATHLAVVGLAVMCAFLGLWQLDRHDQRQALNDRILAAQEEAAAPLDEALGADVLRLRPASAQGTFVQGADVQLGPRSNAQLPGFEVLTPLRLDDGRVLLVNRGWMPLDSPMPPAPAGRVSLSGRLQEPSPARQVLPPDAQVAELVSDPDLDLLAAQVPGLITDAYLEVVDDEALAAGVLPRPFAPVQPTGGNHLSYAFQWFSFGIIGLIGYPLLLRRRIADEEARGPDAPPGAPDAGGRGGADGAPAGTAPDAGSVEAGAIPQ